jgi:hypothetical protein
VNPFSVFVCCTIGVSASIARLFRRGLADGKLYIFGLAGFLGTFTCFAAGTVTLAWDPNNEPDLAGYILHYGTTSGTYTHAVDVGNVITNTVADLDGSTYFFAVTAYNTSGLESDFSNEVTFTPPSVNRLPSISPIPDQWIPLEAGGATLIFGVWDVETPGDQLAVSAVSSNPDLLPFTGILLGGSNTNRSIIVTPLVGQIGTSRITVTVTDVAGGSATASFLLAVYGPNAAPTSDSLPDITINEDSGLQTILLSGISSGDPAELQALTVTAVSSNPSLIPTPVVSYRSPDAAGSLSFSCVPNENGAAVITLMVDDGMLRTNLAVRSFAVTVLPVNDPPVISAITDKSIDEDTPSIISFAVRDLETPETNLVVIATSSNSELIPASGIVLSGSGTNRLVTITPAANQFGSARIWLSVSDGELSQSTNFTLTVNSINDAPAVSAIANQNVDEDTPSEPVGFSVQDMETSAESLALSARSSNPALVPANGITVTGSGTNRTINILPATNQSGSATVTISASDGELNSNSSFLLTVNAVNDVPTISTIANQKIAKNGSTIVPFSIVDVETPAANLVLSAASSNPTLLPISAIVFGGSDSNRTVTITAARGRTGSASVAISVGDGAAQSRTLFNVSVGTLLASPTTGPEIASITWGGSGVAIAWSSIPEITYRIVYKTSLDEFAWNELSEEIVATDTMMSWTDTSVSMGATRFYQVVMVQ